MPSAYRVNRPWLLLPSRFGLVPFGAFSPKLTFLVSTASTLGTFGASYLIRPLGAIVLGTYADRAGRKAAMLVSIILMMVGTLLMAIMPTYATIGIFAPLGILAARLIQGFAVAGEFGSATTFLAEHAPELRGWLRHRTCNAALADDLLQDLFLKALRQGNRFCELTNARAWLFEVARNLLADHLRVAHHVRAGHIRCSDHDLLDGHAHRIQPALASQLTDHLLKHRQAQIQVLPPLAKKQVELGQHGLRHGRRAG